MANGPTFANPDSPLVETYPETVVRLTRERDAAKGCIDSILSAIEGDRFTDGLQTAEQYVRYTLGTAGHLYHVEGFMDVVRERDAAKAELAQLRALHALDAGV